MLEKLWNIVRYRGLKDGGAMKELFVKEFDERMDFTL